MKCSFDEKLSQIKQMNCMVLTKKGKRYGGSDAEIFNIKGTRIYLLVKRTYLPFSLFSQSFFLDEQVTTGCCLVWRYKIKNKKSYKPISFEEVLDHKLLSSKAKTEIVFNLNVFLG